MNQPTAFCACAAATAAMRSSSPFPVRSVAFVQLAAPGAWQKPPPTWSITSSRGSKSPGEHCHQG